MNNDPHGCRNTDYVLVPAEKVDLAVSALKQDGWTFVDE